MKTRVIAPAVAVALALISAGCGGGGGGATPSPPPPPPEGPPPDTPPPPVTVANSIERVKASMTGGHDATSPQLTANVYFLNGPAVSQATPPAGTKALGGFGQIYIAAGNAATNTRVQLRNFETYIRTKAGSWKRVQYSEKVVGELYTTNYATRVAAAPPRYESSGGVSFKPATGQLVRFWPESGVTRSLVMVNPEAAATVDVDNVDAVFTTVQARLVKDADSGADDTAAAKYLVNTAADWWSSVPASGPGSSNFTANQQVGNGKLNFALTDWRAMNFHSATSSSVVDALETPLAGGTAPIANSTPLEAGVAKRVILIGDSITEGSNLNQDSFRRRLWNLIVSDPTNPLIDFVGTRSGTSLNGGTCNPPTPDNDGAYVLREFDIDHQAYWGWCTNQVTGVMPSVLATLAGQQRRPDIALIHLGTNDLTQQGQTGSLVAGEINTLIGALRNVSGNGNANLKALVAKIIPFSSGAPGAAEITALNNAIDGLASVATVVDQNAGFLNSDRYDDFHPNNSGETKMAAQWLTALKAALQ